MRPPVAELLTKPRNLPPGALPQKGVMPPRRFSHWMAMSAGFIGLRWDRRYTLVFVIGPVYRRAAVAGLSQRAAARGCPL